MPRRLFTGVPKKWIALTAIIFVFSMVGWLGAIVILIDNHDQACQSRNDTRLAVAGAFGVMESAIKNAVPPPTEKETAEAKAFFDDLYASLAVEDC